MVNLYLKFSLSFILFILFGSEMNWVFFLFYRDGFVGSVVSLSVIVVALLMQILYCFTVIGNSKWTQ